MMESVRKVNTKISPLFVRMREEVNIPPSYIRKKGDPPYQEIFKKFRAYAPIRNSPVSTIRIGFCGKSYTVISCHDGWKQRCFSDYEAFVSYLEKKADDEDNSKAYILDSLKKAKGRGFGQLNSDNWKKVKQGVDIGPEPFLFLDTPIFAKKILNYRDSPIIRNPCLRDFGFGAFFDSFSAYQEIDMYLGSVLAQQKDPVPDRTDDLIRDSKGFNEISFRNTKPGDKKARRKQNKKNKRKN